MHCRVDNGIVVEGPRDMRGAYHITESVKCVSDEAYLAQDGWFPCVLAAAPVFDPNTHKATSTFVLGSPITQTWVVKPIDPQILADALAAAKAQAVAEFLQRISDARLEAYLAVNPTEKAAYEAILAATSVASLPSVIAP